jgi:hypothetical protein
MFALIVDNFAIKYAGNAHLDYLCQALKKHYKVSEEIDGTCFAGMTLKWNYSPNHAKHSCCLSMPGYTYNICTKYKHSMPTGRQLSLCTSIMKLSLAKPPNSPMWNPTALISPQKASRGFKASSALSSTTHVRSTISSLPLLAP